MGNNKRRIKVIGMAVRMLTCDAGYWMWSVRCGMVTVRCGMLDVGCEMWDVRCWMWGAACGMVHVSMMVVGMLDVASNSNVNFNLDSECDFNFDFCFNSHPIIIFKLISIPILILV